MDDMLKDFVVEALELAVDVEERLLQLERRPNDPETLNAVFRSFHTIKGGAGFMNLPGMVTACHLTENLFDALRTGKTAVTPLAHKAREKDKVVDLMAGPAVPASAMAQNDVDDLLADLGF